MRVVVVTMAHVFLRKRDQFSGPQKKNSQNRNTQQFRLLGVSHRLNVTTFTFRIAFITQEVNTLVVQHICMSPLRFVWLTGLASLPVSPYVLLVASIS